MNVEVICCPGNLITYRFLSVFQQLFVLTTECKGISTTYQHATLQEVFMQSYLRDKNNVGLTGYMVLGMGCFTCDEEQSNMLYQIASEMGIKHHKTSESYIFIASGMNR